MILWQSRRNMLTGGLIGQLWSVCRCEMRCFIVQLWADRDWGNLEDFRWQHYGLYPSTEKFPPVFSTVILSCSDGVSMHHFYGKSCHYMSLLQVKGPKMNPSLCGICLCSLLAIFQHSRSMLNQLHQTTCKNQRSAGPDERLSFCLRKSRVCRTLMMPHGPRQAIYRIYSYLKIRHNFQRFPPRWSYGPTKMVAFLVTAVLIPVLGTGPSCGSRPRWSSMCRVSCLRTQGSGCDGCGMRNIEKQHIRICNEYTMSMNIQTLKKRSPNIFKYLQSSWGWERDRSFLELLAAGKIEAIRTRQSPYRVSPRIRRPGGNGQSLSRLKLSIQLPYVHKTHQKPIKNAVVKIERKIHEDPRSLLYCSTGLTCSRRKKVWEHHVGTAVISGYPKFQWSIPWFPDWNNTF